jgi:hypothetical protein
VMIIILLVKTGGILDLLAATLIGAPRENRILGEENVLF